MEPQTGARKMFSTKGHRTISHRGPQPRGCRWGLVHGLLGPGCTAGSERAKLRSHCCLNPALCTPICGKTVFQETGPWGQRGWGPRV